MSEENSGQHKLEANLRPTVTKVLKIAMKLGFRRKLCRCMDS